MMSKGSGFLSKDDPLWGTLESIATDEELTLYDAERLPGRRMKIFVDKTPNVTSSDTTRLCRRLMVFFSVKGEEFGLGTEPEIEVSSPGINRSLRLQEHYQRALGSRVRVKATKEASPPVVVVGNLCQVEESYIAVEDEQSKQLERFLFENIKEARVDHKF